MSLPTTYGEIIKGIKTKEKKDKKTKKKSRLFGTHINKVPDMNLGKALVPNKYGSMSEMNVILQKGAPTSIMFGRDNLKIPTMKNTSKAKGLPTLHKMAPKINADGYLTRGFNYSNPSFHYKPPKIIRSDPVAHKKTVRVLTSFKKNFGIDISVPKAAKKLTYKNVLQPKFISTSLNKGDSAAVTQISKAKAGYLSKALKNANLDAANAILSNLGQRQIEVVTTQRRRGRYSTKYVGGDPGSVLSDYYFRSAVVDWAKSDPQFTPALNPIAEENTKKASAIQSQLDAKRHELGTYTNKRGAALGTPENKANISRVEGEIKNLEGQLKPYSGTTTLYQQYDAISDINKQKKQTFSKYVGGSLTPELDDKINKLTKEINEMQFRADSLNQQRQDKSIYISGNRMGYINDTLRVLQPAIQQKREELAGLQQEKSFSNFVYSTIPDSDIEEVKQYHGDLVENASIVDTNLELLEKGHVKTGLKDTPTPVTKSAYSDLKIGDLETILSQKTEKQENLTQQLKETRTDYINKIHTAKTAQINTLKKKGAINAKQAKDLKADLNKQVSEEKKRLEEGFVIPDPEGPDIDIDKDYEDIKKKTKELVKDAHKEKAKQAASSTVKPRVSAASIAAQRPGTISRHPGVVNTRAGSGVFVKPTPLNLPFLD